MATSDVWRDKETGERKETTEWSRIVVLNKGAAEAAEKWLKKGSRVYIEGKNQTRKYEKDGRDYYITEVLVLPFNGRLVLLDSHGSGPPPNDGKAEAAKRPDLDDKIPF